MTQFMDWLAEPSGFAEGLMGANGSPLILDPWQRRFLDDRSKIVSVLKSRRVGGSWAMTLKMFIRSQLTPGYRGFFVSMNREEARGRIEYAEELHDRLPKKWRLDLLSRSKDEIAFVDSKGRRSVLTSLAGKAPRGRGGDVGVSELPHCLSANAIYEGALHVTARNVDDRITIESTPLGKRGIFYDLSRGVYSEVRRYEIPWWLCGALCVDINQAAIEAPTMTTADRVQRFGSKSLKMIYHAMPEAGFRQESELAFIEAEDATFAVELLMSCAEPEFSAHEGALRFRHLDRLPTDADWAWLQTNRKGALFAGFDPGRKHDPAALVILDRVGEAFYTRLTINLRDTPFADQRKVVEEACRHGVSAMRIDSSGIGADLAESMERAFPGVIEGFTFTANSKALLIGGGLTAFSAATITIPADRGLIGELSSIRETVAPSGAVVYHSPRDSSGHADRAWALLLALESARGASAVIAPHAAYESLGKRRPRTW